MLKEIIKYVKKNRVSSTEISDALSKQGNLKNIRPLDYQNSLHKVGKIKCVFAYNGLTF